MKVFLEPAVLFLDKINTDTSEDFEQFFVTKKDFPESLKITKNIQFGVQWL